MVRFQDRTIICIGNNNNALFLSPELGGRLVRWRHRGEEILHWPEKVDWSDPIRIRGGNPPLFPFIGRHFVDGVQGRWRDADGHIHTLPQHGFVHELPFEVRSFDAERYIAMALRDSEETRKYYPFGFDFGIEYRLLDDGLEATFTATHIPEGDDPQRLMPFYAGHHFYFALPHALRHKTRLEVPAAWVSRQLPDGSLEALKRGVSEYHLDNPVLQDCYHILEATGAAELTIPPYPDAPYGRRIRVEIDGAPDPWYAITTWTERNAEADFYCIEPWMGLADAIHHGQGLHMLAPGETKTAVCRLVVARE